MLVKKGGIRREIDGKRLEEYREKGFVPVPDPPEPDMPAKPGFEPRKKGPA